MKKWDYVVHDGRTGLITMDLNDMKRVAFLPPERPGQLREATFRNRELRPATPEQAAAARSAGLTRETQRSFLPPRP
ncbi:hypothetical protein ACFXOD_11690 [Streptomyces sp. NPDC059161]|uniref:hypothetical protein n=1 Tax=Streptomyces sp. NPDC059161 TaxID=3346749 RepID=UPI0036C09BA1